MACLFPTPISNRQAKKKRDAGKLTDLELIEARELVKNKGTPKVGFTLDCEATDRDPTTAELLSIAVIAVTSRLVFPPATGVRQSLSG